MSVYGTLVEDKMRRFKSECSYFSFTKCHIYTNDGASANFSTNSHETDNSVADLYFSFCRPLGIYNIDVRHQGIKLTKNTNIK